ncbi:MAG: thioredoxin domain-containing protein [Oscillospiraceae bacterium]|nr:thioredoxin domain-containing protein [Oscillospiraceae bacterium]
MKATLTAEGNRLQYEKSPYLLQHAGDPVHWWSWCPGAFREAKKEDKPILLSIGYSTCHWCHVMGRETFQDPEVAAALNRDFVCIKVDREERPDIDAVYMAVCQALTGSGGWPLTILMTPEQAPFWAGTYLPPRSRDGQLGLLELADEAARLWKSDRQRQLELGQEATRHIAPRQTSSARPEEALLREAVEELARRFDRENGGFSAAPKFPAAHELIFLLEYARRTGDGGALEMAETTLTQMARGGIFDQIGGGFCRYSVDRAWRTPHFEKMLYDNALLSYAFLEAYAQTGRPYYREVARRTLDYVIEELGLPGGGFACGQDADSSGEEGKFYFLTQSDAAETLGAGEIQAFCHRLSIGKTECVPNLLADEQYQDFWEEHRAQCNALAAFRRRRRSLHRDDKVLTGWNAMMIAALSKADRVLGEERYLKAAQSARLFLKTRLTRADGRLWLRWRDREPAIDGQLDDYAFYCWALLELYETNFSPSCLREAAGLADRMAALFWDETDGGFWRTASDGERLIVRQKESFDAGVPSGNAAAGLALAKLARLTGREQFRSLAERQLAWLAGAAGNYPAAHCFALLAMMEELYPSRELVCVSADRLPQWLAGAGEAYRLTVLAKTPENSRALDNLSTRAAEYPLPAKGEQFYLCRAGACQAPVDSPEMLRGLLREQKEPVLQ